MLKGFVNRRYICEERQSAKEIAMTHGRKMLLETLAGHIALLESVNPKKAGSPLARKTRRYIKACLKGQDQWRRLAA